MINKEEIFVNEKHWRGMNQFQLDLFAQKIFDYYMQVGFPYYSTDYGDRVRDFEKMKAYDRSKMFLNDIIKQSMHGLGLAWSYFPHAFDVKCGNKMTPYEAFMDDEIFMKIIHKRLKMGTYISDSGIRKMLKIYSGVQGVSNFRPTAAAAIYDRFAPNGVVWDMSGGWGGRMVGAIVSGVKEYTCTEPSRLTAKGLVELRDDFGGDTNINIIELGSEDYCPDKNSLDLCFTSPPYFDLEKYSNEESQSYVKFKTKKEWVEGFLIETFKNCHFGLKPNGFMLINLADIKGNDLEADMINAARSVGFELVNEFKLALSNVNLRDKGTKFKYEPVYLFYKKWKS